jgi:Xaa-Pro aminopeptidase
MAMQQVDAMQGVIRAAEAAMTAVVAYIHDTDEPTCERAHALIDEVLAQYGCESPEGHIVAVGEQAVEPHEVGHGVIMEGDLVVVDIYPRSKTTGYWADITRTVCKGAPRPEAAALFATVAEAQQLAISLVAPGVPCRDVHTAIANFFTAAGYKTSGVGKEFRFSEGFVHALGHGVNTDLHADPKLSSRSDAVLKVGDVITVEPGLYYKAIGGVRLEDMVIVTETGCDVLTHVPTKLVLR